MRYAFLALFLLISTPLCADWDSQKVSIAPLEVVATSDTVTLTASVSQRLPDVGPVSSILLKASAVNNKLVRWGGSWIKTQSMSIATGDSVILDIDDLSDIYVMGEQTGDRLEYACLR